MFVGEVAHRAEGHQFLSVLGAQRRSHQRNHRMMRVEKFAESRHRERPGPKHQ